jgi:hypothetical protein
MEFQNVYVLQFVKSFTIYYIKNVCTRIWVNRVHVQELRWEIVKKNSTEKINTKMFLSYLFWEKKRVSGHNY